jgi:hypothetical protein
MTNQEGYAGAEPRGRTLSKAEKEQLFKQLGPQWDRLEAEVFGEEVPVVVQHEQQQTPEASFNGQANALAWNDEVPPVTFPPSVTIKEFAAHATPVTWFLEDVLADGAITAFNGRFKHGKTQWLCDLLRAAGKGRTEWCGKKLDAGPVLIITQEGTRTWKKRETQFELKEKLVRFKPGWGSPRPYYGHPTLHLWKSLVHDIVVNEVLPHNIRLVIFDVIADFWPVRNHLDTGEINEAITALRWITDQTPAGVLLLGHLNQRGDHKGNNESLGAVDTIVKFGLPSSKHKAKHPGRKLQVQGRFIDTEFDLYIRRTEAGYVLDKAPASTKNAEEPEEPDDREEPEGPEPSVERPCKPGPKHVQILKELCEAHPGTKTKEDLMMATEQARSTLNDQLKYLRQNCGFVEEEAAAGKATTYRASDDLMDWYKSSQLAS